MSLPKENRQTSFFDVSFQAEGMFEDEQNPYRIFHDEILPALRAARGELVKVYCEENGRPAVEPVVMAGVSLLQFMQRVPDRQAGELVKYHLGWKYALDLELGYEGFHPTSLVKFRNRLVQGGEERVVFEAVVQKLRDEGLVKRRGKRRLDSTHVLGLVSEMSRLERTRETIRLFLVEATKIVSEERMAPWERLLERYCDTAVDWHKQSKEQLRKKFDQAGIDALSLIKWVRQQEARLRDSDQAILLERVFLEQFELGGQEPEVRKVEGSGTMHNPHDPDAQWAAKDTAGKTAWVGYKAQVMETVPEDGKTKETGEPTDQFIADIVTTEAIASDKAGMERMFEGQDQRGEDRPDEMYTDAGYVSAEALAQAKEEGRELLGPALPSPRHKQGYPSEMFDVDTTTRTAICPAGKTNSQCSLINDSHQGTSYYRFEWGAQCDGCEFQKQCTKSKNGRRILSVGIHHNLLQQRRREQETEAFKERMKQRNAIEGTISELSRSGMRRSRYRGGAKTALANCFHAAAINVKRFIRLTAWNMASE